VAPAQVVVLAVEAQVSKDVQPPLEAVPLAG